MMAQIGHRESHDVDIFLQDPQLLSYLDPQKHDFEFEPRPSDYSGDGTGFLKLSFKDIGEIDFIVSQPKTADPTIEAVVEGVIVLLETVPEIITKKIVHRGSSLRPRDVFDIAAAAEVDVTSLIAALRSYPEEVATARETLGRLNPEFVSRTISQLQIREKFDAVAKQALERTKQILEDI